MRKMQATDTQYRPHVSGSQISVASSRSEQFFRGPYIMSRNKYANADI